MSKIKFSIGDNVAFHRDVVRRVGLCKDTADARGVVVDLNGPVVSVDFKGTWVKHENGGDRATRTGRKPYPHSKQWGCL